VDGQQIEVMRITQEAWCGKAPTERKVVVRFHPNVQYYTMEYDYLLRELRLGRDVVFFDSRGLSPTEFAPSEEGFYMDADAVYHKVRDEWGYLPQNTWITARCSGTTQAIYLRHRYQDDGFHMVLENPFERWSALIARQGWPLSSMGLSAMDSLRSQDPLTLAKAQEHGFDLYVDHFDNMRKLQAISKNLHHTRVVIISTLTDKLIGQGPADAVEAAAARTMEVYHLKYPGQDPAVDGHFEDVFSNSDIVTTYSELVT
jgi:hypothetical protein